VKDALLYTSRKKKELDMIFPFEHVILDYGMNGKFDVKEIDMDEFRKTVVDWQLSLNGRSWNTLYLTNHDHPRAISRYANDGDFRIESGKLLATLLLTLQGTPFVYQGEEIGMTNVKFPDIVDYKDVEIHNYYKAAMEKGIDREEIMNGIYMHGRDNSRTPMQWDDSVNSGFSEGTPWIKVNPNYKDVNVKKSAAEKNSILNYYKNLIAIRKNNLCLIYGDFIPLEQKNKNIFSYLRKLDNDRFLIVMNFSANMVEFHADRKIKYDDADFIIGNYNIDNGQITNDLASRAEASMLMPYEARVLKLS
jgi:oligo-1,6-glucosidase